MVSPSDTKICPTCGVELHARWINNKSLKGGGRWQFRCDACLNHRQLAKQPGYTGVKGRPHIPRQRYQGEYAPQPTGTFCETCGRELNRYWRKSARYKNGGTWYSYCPGCKYREGKDRNQNYQKDLYARRKELHPQLGQEISPWKRAWTLRTKYNLPAEEYAHLLEQQGGVCAICKQEETQKHRNGKIVSLSVDHDHETGKVRGLLCSRCNLLLGMIETSPHLIELMMAYLEERSGGEHP